MAEKSRSGRKSGSTNSGDAGDKDRLIAELKDRVAVVENELRLKQSDTTSQGSTDRELMGEYRVLFQRIVDKAADMVFLLGPMGCILYVNEATCKALGYTREELQSMTVFDINQIHHEDNWQEHEEELKNQGSMTFENVLKTKDNRFIPVEISANYARLGDREYNYSFIRDITERKRLELELVEHRDKLQELVRERTRDLEAINDDLLKEITDRKRAEEAIRSSEERFRSYFEMPLIGIAITSPEKGWILANDKICAMLGYSKDDLVRTTWNKLTHPDDLQVDVDCFNRLLSGEINNYTLDKRFIRKDGSIISTTISIGCVRKPDGTVDYIVDLMQDITERKRAEEALAAAHRQFQSIIDNTPAIVYAFDLEERLVMANTAIAELFNSTPEQMIGKRRHEFMPKEDADWHEANDRQAIEAGRAVEFEEYSQLKGRSITWLTTKFPLRDARGRIYAVAGISADITERKRAEDELRRSRDELDERVRKRTSEMQKINEELEARIQERNKAEEAVRLAYAYNRSLIEASLDPLVTISPDGMITDVNKATENFTGTQREKLIGADFSDYFTEPEKAKEGYLKAFKEGSVTDYPLEIRHQDGHVTPVIYNASVYRDEAGKVIGVFAAARDITEQKKIEKARLRLAAIVDSSDDAIIGKTLNGIIMSWNAGAIRLYGYTEDEVLGKSISILSTPDYPNEVPGILEKIRHGEHIEHYETMRKRKDDSIVNVSLSVSPIRELNGRIVGASTITRDITERKRAEEAVKLANVYNRNLIEASLDPLVTISPDGVITDVNKATETVTGYPREYLIGTDFSDYFTDPDKAREGYMQVFKEGSVTDYPLEIRHRDGHITPVIYNASVYHNEVGQVIGMFAAARDITERKKAEEELRHAHSDLEKKVEERTEELMHEKMQAELYLDLMGHDINNLHQVALGYLEMARDMPAGEEQTMFLDKPVEVLQRSAKLISNVRKLQKLRDGVFQTQEVDVCKVLSDVQREYGAVPDKTITLNLNGCERCRVRANELMHDVFANLVGNAAKHTGNRAAIVVDLDVVADNGGRYCRVVVDDDGPGIPDGLKGVIFNRGLKGTDKAKGMGLGLYLVKSLVDSYGGRVWVEDRVQGDHTKGARFVVLLPAVE